MTHRHSYSSVVRDQSNWEGQLAIVSVVLSIGLGYGAEALFGLVAVDVPWLLSPPSALGVWALVRKGYRDRLWRSRIRGRRLVDVPYLGGTWLGTVMIDDPGQATFVDFPTGTPQLCTVTVAQSLHEICVQFDTDVAESSSLTATIDASDGTGAAHLEYSYHAKPKFPSNRNFLEHNGIASLVEVRPPPLPSGSPVRRLQGHYYTSAPQHSGIVDITFLSEERKALAEVDLSSLPPAISDRYASAIDAYQKREPEPPATEERSTGPGPTRRTRTRTTS